MEKILWVIIKSQQKTENSKQVREKCVDEGCGTEGGDYKDE